MQVLIMIILLFIYIYYILCQYLGYVLNSYIYIFDWLGQQLAEECSIHSILGVTCQHILATGGFMLTAIMRLACKKKLMCPQLTGNGLHRMGYQRYFH